MKKNIAVISGGFSSEYEVSIKSGKKIISSLDNNKYNIYSVLLTKDSWIVNNLGNEAIEVDKSDFSIKFSGEKIFMDCALITIHGDPGENGILQGYFELLNIPYSTCDVATSALTFDKYRCNKYLRSLGIDVADSVLLTKDENVDTAFITNTLGLPCFVKPNASGSSCGVSKVSTIEELIPAIEEAFTESNLVIVESFISGTEVTCGILKTSKREYILPITELETENEFFDYEAKYTDGVTKEITPARISKNIEQKCNEITSKVYDLVGCKGVVRIDFIIQNNKPFLIEINTTPGMTENSIIPQQVACYGIGLGEFFSAILTDSMEKK